MTRESRTAQRSSLTPDELTSTTTSERSEISSARPDQLVGRRLAGRCRGGMELAGPEVVDVVKTDRPVVPTPRSAGEGHVVEDPSSREGSDRQPGRLRRVG